MSRSAAIDPSRLYKHPTKIRLAGIGLYPVFEWDGDIPNYYREYLVLWVGEDIPNSIMDYDVIISLN